MMQLVVGAGEVGQALSQVLRCPVADVHYAHEALYERGELRVLHIAFPWSDSFREEVDRYEDMYEPEVVVVHSTVPVGTCDAAGWIHSPVRGRHPHLAEGIRAFTKHIGGGPAVARGVVTLSFSEAGLVVEAHDKAATTELGKLTELAQLGVEVRMQKEIHALCQRHGVDFSEAYHAFTRTYNAGYRSLGEHRFVKPNLTHVPGPLGGHCVAQNTPMLGSEFFDGAVGPISPDEWAGEVE